MLCWNLIYNNVLLLQYLSPNTAFGAKPIKILEKVACRRTLQRLFILPLISLALYLETVLRYLKLGKENSIPYFSLDQPSIMNRLPMWAFESDLLLTLVSRCGGLKRVYQQAWNHWSNSKPTASFEMRGSNCCHTYKIFKSYWSGIASKPMQKWCSHFVYWPICRNSYWYRSLFSWHARQARRRHSNTLWSLCSTWRCPATPFKLARPFAFSCCTRARSPSRSLTE